MAKNMRKRSNARWADDTGNEVGEALTPTLVGADALTPNMDRDFSESPEALEYIYSTLLPEAVEAEDKDRVKLLEEVLYKYGITKPNHVSGYWGEWKHIPRNEHELRELFALRLPEFGYRMVSSQDAFPDWFLLDEEDNFIYAEVEHRSANFAIHKHDPTHCDLVVCWEHNDPTIPLPVLEVFSEQLIQPQVPREEVGDRRVALSHPKLSKSTVLDMRKRLTDNETLIRRHRNNTVRTLVEMYMKSESVNKTTAVKAVAKDLGLVEGSVWNILSRK